jgi:hypothetical protein
MCLSWFFGMPGDQDSIDWVRPIEGAFILGISKDGAQDRLYMLQRRCREIVRFGDRAQHSTGVHGAKFSQVQLSDVIANVIDPDFMVALTGASSPLLLGPRQIRSFDEGGQCDSRICTEPIAIDR